MSWSKTKRSLVRVELDQVQFIGRAFGFGSERGMGQASLVVVTYGRCLLVDGDRRREGFLILSLINYNTSLFPINKKNPKPKP